MKYLIKTFSYYQLLEECEKQGWCIPHSSELKDVEYNDVWVTDLPAEEDRETHGYIYRQGYGLLLANKSFIENAVVIKLPEDCENCKYAHEHHECYTLYCELGVSDGESSCEGVEEDFYCNKFERKE